MDSACGTVCPGYVIIFYIRYSFTLIRCSFLREEYTIKELHLLYESRTVFINVSFLLPNRERSVIRQHFIDSSLKSTPEKFLVSVTSDEKLTWR